MKEDVLNKYHGDIAQAESDLYDAAFADGAASVPAAGEDVTPFDQAYVDGKLAEQKAIDDQILADAKADLQAKIDQLGLELSQKDADALEEALADKLAALAQELRDRTVKVTPQPEPQPEPETPPAV